MHQLAPLIYDLALMLGTAGLVVLLFQRIKQPIILGYLVAGMLVGPYTPPHALVHDVPNIEILSELGVIFLLFSLGLEFSFQKLTRVGFSAAFIGVTGILSMMSIGYVAGVELGWSYYDSLFLGAALSIASTTIIVKAIDELKLKTKMFAELIVGVLIVEDLVTILLLVGLTTMVATSSLFSMEMVYASIKLVVVVGGWFLIGYFIMPPLFRRLEGRINQEMLTIIAVALCLSLVCAAAHYGYSSALGAFIMGSILAETTFGHRIERLIHPIRDIFGAVFFISVGMLINPGLILKDWKIVLFLATITILGKMITKSIAAVLSGERVNTSVRVGFGMAPVGEFSFIVASLGATLNVTSNRVYPIVVAISGITTFLTPYLIRFSAVLVDKIDAAMPERITYLLDKYSTWIVRSQASSKTQSYMQSVSVRLISNGIIVAIVFTAVDTFVFPELQRYLPTDAVADLLAFMTAALLSSPFIWGMLFSYQAVQKEKGDDFSLHPGMFVVWALTLTQVIVLGLVYFHTWLIITLLAVITTIFFAFMYRRLETSYQWFERQLVSNIRRKSKRPKKYESLAPWETHLVDIKVGIKSAFVGKTLEQSQVRQRFDINVVAIYHGSRVIPAPRGDERIFANDRLIVLGTDEQIDAFRKEIEVEVEEVEKIKILDTFALKAILLEDNNLLIGKTIRASQLRENIDGLVVGLERGDKRILNPNSNTILELGDLVLIVGDAAKLVEWRGSLSEEEI